MVAIWLGSDLVAFLEPLEEVRVVIWRQDLSF